LCSVWFKSAANTWRVANNRVSCEVVEILNHGGQFGDVRELVAGARGRKVFEEGDVEARVWTVGTAMGLIHEIPTVVELVRRIVDEAEGGLSPYASTP
jgi:NADH:quinone reductase (non-electrogenic)